MNVSAMRRIPAPSVPTHWIDTMPVKSTDKPCAVDSLDVRARVSGLHAEVVQTMAISNPNERDLSVGIAVPMPDRAVVCGYALDIDGQMVDGVVVPKEKARVAFETEQRIGADPGLVESVKGNVYRTRVYPVPGRGRRTVRLRYVAPLLVVDGGAALLDLPMPSESLGERSIRVEVELPGCPAPEISGVGNAEFEQAGVFWAAESRERDLVPGAGVRVVVPDLPASFALVERDEAGALWFSASEAAPQHVEGVVPTASALTVLWDVSGSRAAVDHTAELELLRGYCAAESVGKFRLIAFGDRPEPALEFDDPEELLGCIASLRYDGGSDFCALSAALAESPEVYEDALCVLFTDGMDTLGEGPVSFPKGCKVLAILSGPERDAEMLRQACGGRAFDLAAAPKGAEALMRAAFLPNLLTGVEGGDVSDIIGIGSGADGRYSVVGRLAGPSARIAFENTGTEFALDGEGAREGTVISRAWAAMRTAQLSSRADENAGELLDLGRRFGVVSPATSLLVLESLDQWLRYDIEPPKTWEKMHDEWEHYRQGAMRLSSEREEAERHLGELKREWAKLLEWWKRDYPVAVADGSSCPSCDAPIEPGSRFCPACGASLSDPGRIRDFGDLTLGRMARSVSRASADMSASFTGGMVPEEYLACAPVACEEACTPMERAMPESAPMERDMGESAPDSAAATVKVKAWMPDAEYLAALDGVAGDGPEAAREAYFRQRPGYASSPSFFVDCAGWFMAHGDGEFGMRVLTNLAELRIEDAALLRVMAWRLREAGELGRSLSVLRRVLGLRPEDSQSHRDLALVLDELARKSYAEGDESLAREHAEEAASFYREIALTPWQRRRISIALFAVEEYNVLRAWADAQSWEVAPELEPLGEGLGGVLDCDLRITLAWDADETDVDLHVTEPNGEEAYYGNRLTYDGGRVSEDITDGYGPELYEIRHAKDGVYVIRAHYFASHQQTVFGPASCTLTVYTDWGRPAQAQQVTSTRLESEKEMVPVGTAAYGVAAEGDGRGDEADGEGDAPSIAKGASVSDLVAAFGQPSEGDPDDPDGDLLWNLPGGRTRIATVEDGKAVRVVERMSWGEEMVIVQ